MSGIRDGFRFFSPLPSYGASDIKAIRNSLALTQSSFSFIFGVSTKTIEAWQSGINKPQGPALRLLDLFVHNPEMVSQYFEK
jgi:putative transcriptional regulator